MKKLSLVWRETCKRISVHGGKGLDERVAPKSVILQALSSFVNLFLIRFLVRFLVRPHYQRYSLLFVTIVKKRREELKEALGTNALGAPARGFLRLSEESS